MAPALDAQPPHIGLQGHASAGRAPITFYSIPDVIRPTSPACWLLIRIVARATPKTCVRKPLSGPPCLCSSHEGFYGTHESGQTHTRARRSPTWEPTRESTEDHNSARKSPQKHASPRVLFKPQRLSPQEAPAASTASALAVAGRGLIVAVSVAVVVVAVVVAVDVAVAV